MTVRPFIWGHFHCGFSSAGPQDGFKKPDIVAPSWNQFLANKSLEYKTVGNLHGRSCCSRMCRLLYEKNPQMTPLQIKELIMSNATDLGLDPNKQGTGLLNIEKIINAMKKGPLESSPDSPYAGDDIIEPSSSMDMFLMVLLVLIILTL